MVQAHGFISKVQNGMGPTIIASMEKLNMPTENKLMDSHKRKLRSTSPNRNLCWLFLVALAFLTNLATAQVIRPLHTFSEPEWYYNPAGSVQFDTQGNLYGSVVSGLGPAPIGGASEQVEVILTGPAPAGGFTVNLASSSGLATLPPSVHFIAGQSIALVTLSTVATAVSVPYTISASAGTKMTSINMLLNP